MSDAGHHPPHLTEASSVELAHADDGFTLTFAFPTESGRAATVRMLSRRPNHPDEAVWMAEEELKDIFGRIPARDDGDGAPIVATWRTGSS